MQSCAVADGTEGYFRRNALSERANDHGKRGARFIQLKEGEPGPCLFMIPGLGGRIEGLVELAARLEIPLPVFAIEARGVHGSESPDSQIDEMAGHYVSGVKKLQPSEPYFLVGHSSGGLIAFAMAQQLVRAREKVACLILLDTSQSKKCWPLSYRLKVNVASLRNHLTTVLRLPAGQKPQYITDNCKKFLRKLLDPYGLKVRPPDVTVAGRIAGDGYYPEFYPGRLIFFRADIKEIPADPNILWRHRVRELEFHSALGGHNSMLNWPNVSSLAEEISACVAEILRNSKTTR
jgi:acetoacetyl-CoA synthetase